MKKQAAIAGAAIALLGTLTFLAGVAWPSLRGGPSDAEKTQASEFLSTASNMEAAASLRDREQRQAAIAEAREAYLASRETIEAAQAADQRTMFWLKVVGGSLAVVGVGVLLANKPQ